jgi:hypothetical protein
MSEKQNSQREGWLLQDFNTSPLPAICVGFAQTESNFCNDSTNSMADANMYILFNIKNEWGIICVWQTY